MARIKNILSVVFSVVMTLALAGCQDDFLYESTTDAYEGPVTLTLGLSFHPLTEGLSTRGVDANLDFELRDLTILFYDSEADEQTGKPEEVRHYTSLNTDQEERESDTEPHTRHTSVTVEGMEAGKKYRIYAVANVAEALSGAKWEELSEKQLREQVIEWKSYAENEQYTEKDPRRYAIPDAMFGYFHQATGTGHDAEHKAEAGGEAQDVIHHTPSLWNYSTAKGDREITENRAAVITLSSKNVAIHAWLKRTISRLTVGFDGSQLNRGVEIYVKSVHVRDAISSSFLGHDNAAARREDFVTDNPSDERLHHVYSREEGPVGAAITKTTPAFPRPEGNSDMPTKDSDGSWNNTWYEYVHGNKETLDPADSETKTPVALYFMENIQGKETDYTEYPKSYHDGWKENSETWNKDGKPLGTYVEVEAYYCNTRAGSKSEGTIKYRFMLGQNITDDFNTERNRHYKLTLQFKGDANDVDWHIEYEEEKKPEGFYFRIPYNLDDDDADFPFADEENDEYWYENENWKQSYIWYAYDDNNNPIAEIVKELVYYDAYGYTAQDPRNNLSLANPILRTFYQVVTVYPMDADGDTDFNNGIIAQVLACDKDNPGEKKYYTKVDGSKIAMTYRTDLNTNVEKPADRRRGDCVIISSELTPDIVECNDKTSHENYLYVKYDSETEVLSLIEEPLNKKLETRPYLEKDPDGNKYPIVKIGGSYWFREALKTTHYLEGAEIHPYQSGVEPFTEGDVYLKEGKAMYKNDDKYGFRYNLAALISDESLDPWIEKTYDDYSYVLCQKGTEDSNGEIIWGNGTVSYQITPKGWHIPVALSYWDPGIFWERHSDLQYIMDYMSDNLARAIVDTDQLKWPGFPDVKQPNLSGLSLLAIPADGESSTISYVVTDEQLKQGDLTGIYVPFWMDNFYHVTDDGKFYAFPPFMNYADKRYYREETLTTSLIRGERNSSGVKSSIYAAYYKAISEQYLPIRPCRNPLVFRPRYWSEIGDWIGVSNRNQK